MENMSISPTLLDALRLEAKQKTHLSYADFIRIVAFDPQAGYYAKHRDRVGRSPETDFYTAESLGRVFGQLVAAAAIDLLGSREEAEKHVFVEIGAEPGRCVLDGVRHPFPETLVLRLNDPKLIPRRSVVFANEWLDSLPFNRLRFDQAMGWQELGVTIKANELQEITLPSLSAPVQGISNRLPTECCENYRLDLTINANDALREIVSQEWRGAFFTFDYGKPWGELIHEHPKGTARVYENHRSHGDLLSRPGEVDMTCHLCWDFLIEVLQKANFSNAQVERQESFLVKRASKAIRAIIEKNSGGIDEECRTLQELLHPACMGDAFQVLSAVR
ncbi:MAG: SAM-dependent methyltransferase [Opitutales bacterium]